MNANKGVLNPKDVSKINLRHLPEHQFQQKKLGMIDVVLLLVVFACAFHFFNLTEWAWKHGVFNTRDIGLLIIGIWFIRLLLQGRLNMILFNGFSKLLIIFLFFMLIQTSIASFIYEQSIIDGLIAVRHQFYYLSFFIFLGLLSNERKIHQALNIMTVLAVILSLLGLINHFVITIYYHQWAEGHGVRAGVLRAYVAGIDIITLSLFWSALQWVYNKKTRVRYFLGGLIFFLMIVLRQTRGRLVAILGASIILLIYKKNYRVMFSVTVFATLILLLAGVFSEENILVESYVTTYEEMSKGSEAGDRSNWAARLEQLDMHTELFMEHPWIGSGTSALRAGSYSGMSTAERSYLSTISRNEDLGYSNWIKSYGIAGIIWLMTFYYLLGKYMKRSTADHKGNLLEPVALLVSAYLIYVLISFVTLPHLMRPDLILLFCFVLAILVRTYQLGKKVQKK